MVQFNGQYVLEEAENAEKYFTAFGVSLDQIKTFSEPGIVLEVEVLGNNITFGTSSRTRLYILNSEVEETMPDGTVLKSTIVNNGDEYLITSKGKDGATSRRSYTFSDFGLIVTFTSERTTESAKFIYSKK